MSLTPLIEAPGAPHELGLKDYLAIVQRRRKVFLLVIALVLAAGMALTMLSKDLYRTQATLVIPTGSRPTGAGAVGSPIDMMMAAVQPDNLEVQARQLQSAELLQAARARANLPPTERGGG